MVFEEAAIGAGVCEKMARKSSHGEEARQTEKREDDRDQVRQHILIWPSMVRQEAAAAAA